MDKLKLKDRRELYRIFGNYSFEGISHLPESELVGFELIMSFSKTLSQQQATSALPSTFVPCKHNYKDFEAGSSDTIFCIASVHPNNHDFEIDDERKREFFESIRQL